MRPDAGAAPTHHHTHRLSTPSRNAAALAAMLLKVDSATVIHPSHSAPTFRTRGHISTYLGRLEIDSPAVASGTATHHGVPKYPANPVTSSSQYSGERSALRSVIPFPSPSSMASSQKRASQYDKGHGEVDHQPGHIDER